MPSLELVSLGPAAPRTPTGVLAPLTDGEDAQPDDAQPVGLTTPVFNPAARETGFDAGGVSAEGDERAGWRHAVDFMMQPRGVPYFMLAAWGCLVAFLGLLVTVGVL